MSTPLRRARVYRNVELPQQWLGLEPFDALGVITLGWLLMLVNRAGMGWNALLLVLTYAGLRLGKRGKPEGFTRSVVRHYLRRPFFSAAARDRQAAAHPFTGAVPAPSTSEARRASPPAVERSALGRTLPSPGGVPPPSTSDARRAFPQLTAGVPAAASGGSHLKGDRS